MERKVKILMVCHGNICRSTMAQSVLNHMVTTRKIETNFYIDSAATSREEIGNPPHYGTVNRLRQAGITVVPHRARQMTRQDYEAFDYLIGMDNANIRNMKCIAGGDEEEKLWKLLSFATGDLTRQDRSEERRVAGRDVADPWYTGDFEATYRDVVRGCEGLIRYLGY